MLKVVRKALTTWFWFTVEKTASARVDPAEHVWIDYTNWRGERSTRAVLPLRFFYGTSEFHRPNPEWLMDAFDIDKQALRTFSMCNIHSWKKAGEIS